MKPIPQITFGLGLVLALSGCTDVRGRFDAFSERKAAAQQRDAELAQMTAEPDAGGATDAGAPPCVLPEPGELQGLFLMAISVKLAPGSPVVTLLEVDASEADGALRLQMTETLLSATDRMTIVGEQRPLPDIVSTAPEYMTDTFEFVAIGEANAITGMDISTEVSLSGTLCSSRAAGDPEATIEFFCGDVNGVATAPLMLPLNDSTFAAVRIPDAESIPTDIFLNCARDLADPL